MQRIIRKATTAGLSSVISAHQLFPRVEDHSPFVLEEIKRIEIFQSDSLIYRRGQAANTVYILLDGRARLTNRGSDARLKIVRPHMLCGLFEVLANSQYRGELRTITPCICSLIGRDDLLEFLRREPKVALRLSKRISRDYHVLTESLLYDP